MEKYNRENVYRNADKAIQRLVWRLSPQKQFTPNQNDINALNELIMWINHERENRVNHNHHFAKLFMFLYNEWSIKFEDVNHPQKAICKILEQPLVEYYRQYRDTVNMVWFLDYLENLGLADALNISGLNENWTKEKSEKALKENAEILKKVSAEDFLKNAERYSMEEVTEKLNDILGEALHRYEDISRIELPHEKYLKHGNTVSTGGK